MARAASQGISDVQVHAIYRYSYLSVWSTKNKPLPDTHTKSAGNPTPRLMLITWYAWGEKGWGVDV